MDTTPSIATPAGPTAREAALSRLVTARLERRIPPLTAAMGASGVDVVLLKGPVTRQRLYSADEVRPTADIDLLVGPAHQRRARRTLARLGYVLGARAGHADAWTRPGDATVDLHVSLPFASVSARAVWRALAPHVATERVAGALVPALDEPAHLLHLAIHAAQHRFDPSARAVDELGRAVAAISPAGLSDARDLAAAIGVAGVFELALDVIAEPSATTELAALLPVRRAGAGEVGAFVRSPVHWRLRSRSLRRTAGLFWSEGRTDTWLVERGKDLPSPRWCRVAATAERVARTVAREVRSMLGRDRRA